MSTEDDKPVSVVKALRLARKSGIKDPIVKCHDHGVSIPYSKLSPNARMALEAGLDVAEGECLLMRK